MKGGIVTDQLGVTLEIGPKGKRVVAIAPDWPGLERGAKTAEAAIERLLAYAPRLCYGGEAGWHGGHVYKPCRSGRR